MDPQDRQVVGFDRGEITGGLRVDERPERVRPARDLDVGWMIGCQLDEPADRRATLVQLAGRVEEARSVAGGGRPPRAVAQERPDPGHRRVARGGGRDERLEAEVGVPLPPRELASELADDVAVAMGQAQCGITEERQAVAARDGLVRATRTVVMSAVAPGMLEEPPRELL